MDTMKPVGAFALVLFSAQVACAQLSFVEVADAAGVSVVHGYNESAQQIEIVAGGAAGGDFNGDGWPDLYVIGANSGGQRLFRNDRNGTFSEVAVHQPPGLMFERLCGPAFADIDGDNDLDLFVGTVEHNGPALFRNDGESGLIEISRGQAAFQMGPVIGASFGDYDRDGDLDLLTAHWSGSLLFGVADHLWDNDGAGVFRGVTEERGLSFLTEDFGDLAFYWTFSGNFVDIDGDGWLDILMASDFAFSQMFVNDGAGGFLERPREALTDQNGMGTAVGDYDNDGDLDWFVTSIAEADPARPVDDWQDTGNRLYRNDGAGNFHDVSESAGVRNGSWGWAACFADMDNDTDLDIFHVNGWETELSDVYKGHPARLFVNQGNGSFLERAESAGIADTGEGRGVVCFDYDRDGDIDVFISNNDGPSRLYRNDTASAGHYLQVKLVGRRPNTEAIGGRIAVTTQGLTQMRELRSGNHFVSQSPAVAHFGLGEHDVVDTVQVRWPLGGVTVLDHPIAADQRLIIFEEPADANCDGRPSAADITSILRVPDPGLTLAPCPARDLNYDGHVDQEDWRMSVTGIFGS